MNRLLVIGLSHRTAPVDVREALALPEDAVRAQLQAAAQLSGGEAMVLSTCNRVELYTVVPEGESAHAGPHAAGHDAHRPSARMGAFEDILVATQPSARGYLYRHQGDDALRHLFRVASSLDSLVIGEPQILGQVKAAYRLATTAGTAGSTLSSAIPRAFSVAKRVRTETPIGKSAASVASVGVDLATQVFGELRGHPVLLIGAGKMAELCARHLREAGADQLLIANRTRSRAEDLAARLGGSAHDLTELDALLSRATVVICSAGAKTPIITHDQVSRVMRARRGRWLLFIDIAVPRDVEPSVADIENVYLYDIDALSDVAAGNRSERQRAAAQAEAIIDEELRRARERVATADVTPVIKALRKKAEGIAQAEVARVLPRLAGLADRDRALVSGLADAIVNKLLHEPLMALKRGAVERQGAAGGPDLADAVTQLWSLSPASPSPDSADRDGTERDGSDRNSSSHPPNRAPEKRAAPQGTHKS